MRNFFFFLLITGLQFENSCEVGVFSKLTNAYCLVAIGGSENFYRCLCSCHSSFFFSFFSNVVINNDNVPFFPCCFCAFLVFICCVLFSVLLRLNWLM